MPKIDVLFSSLLTLSSVSLGGCYVQAGTAPVVAQSPPPPAPIEPPVVEAQPVAEAQPVVVQAAVEPAPEYYYGGAHFYPLALGGDWCPIAEPHLHDFPPDHPEYYAYDNGYYYYAGRPGEVYVVGRTPVGARVHVVREGEGHEWRRLPPDAPRPHLVAGRYPSREGHPAPLHPVAGRGRLEEHQVAEKREEHQVAEKQEDHRQPAEHEGVHPVEVTEQHSAGRAQPVAAHEPPPREPPHLTLASAPAPAAHPAAHTAAPPSGKAAKAMPERKKRE